MINDLLSTWCKEVQIAMIKRDISLDWLATFTGYKKYYVAGVIHGRYYSKGVVEAISNALDIEIPNDTTIGMQ